MTTDRGRRRDLQPDIAAALPEVSADGLTWTFTLKSGVKYGDPFGDVSVTSGDIVRALEREADPDATSAATTSTTRHRRVRRLRGRQGRFDHRPRDARRQHARRHADRAARLTCRTGSRWRPPRRSRRTATRRSAPPRVTTSDYGRFLVATGPYQFQGAENLDFSVAGRGPEAGRGLRARHVDRQLVRNPNYDPATDDLRPAYADAINVTIGGDNNDLYNKVSAGELDFVVDGAVPPNKILRRTRPTRPAGPCCTSTRRTRVRYISFNLAMPPFDDIHVRKAVNLALDKAGLQAGSAVASRPGDRRSHHGELAARTTSSPTTTRTPRRTRRVTSAAGQDEMAQSKYDTERRRRVRRAVVRQHPGRHRRDGPVPGPGRDPDPAEPGAARYHVGRQELERTTMYTKCNDAQGAVGDLPRRPRGARTSPTAYTFGGPLFDSAAIFPSCCNY